MTFSDRDGEATDDKILGLVDLAASQSGLFGMGEILQFIGDSLNASVCLLWESAHSHETKGDLADQLRLRAHWSKTKSTRAIHELTLDSATGAAVASGEPGFYSTQDERADRSRNLFFSEHDVKTFCVVPLHFGDSHLGALSVYRSVDLPFSLVDMSSVRRFGRILPALYQSIRERAAYALIGKVRGLVESPVLDDESATRVIDELCQTLAAHFSCIESSVFLEDRRKALGTFELQATTCNACVNRRSYALGDSGITPWALRNRRAVIVFDLAKFDRDAAAIQHNYPGLAWQDLTNIRSVARTFLNLAPDETLPPLSLLVVPVIVGDEIVGAIRCCTSTQAPYYFSDREVELLNIVASQIGNFWKGWSNRRQLMEEIASWRTFGEGIRLLNDSALSELERGEPEMGKIYHEGLRAAAKVIPGAEILDVRLYDETRAELYFSATCGPAWEEGSQQEIKRRRSRRFPVGPQPCESAGAWVFQNARSHVIPDTHNDSQYSATFPEVNSMIIAPISSRRRTYGVLDIRSTGRSFPVQAEAMTELLCEQLGLYQYLAETRRQLVNTTRVQVQSYEDLEHQLRSPIRQAMERLSALRSGAASDSRKEYMLNAAHGLIRRAHGIVNSIRMFRILHEGSLVPTDLEVLTEDGLVKSLIEICVDNTLLFGSETGVQAQVDRESFAALRDYEVKADRDLLQQAVQNVVENAFKYSQPQTVIHCTGGIGGGSFYISVKNVGIVFTEHDAKRASQRGWRGDIAISVTPSGSGIGLWIVDNVMRAQNGRLDIIPTSRERITEIRLLLPLSKRPLPQRRRQ